VAPDSWVVLVTRQPNIALDPTAAGAIMSGPRVNAGRWAGMRDMETG